MGRRGQLERSSELSLLFFLWGYLKRKVYVNRLDIIKGLKNDIRKQIPTKTRNIIQNVTDEIETPNAL